MPRAVRRGLFEVVSHGTAEPTSTQERKAFPAEREAFWRSRDAEPEKVRIKGRKDTLLFVL